MGVLQEITDRKGLESGSRRITANGPGLTPLADEATAAKGEFLTVMSHELRTPLNAVIGFSALLEEEVFGGLTTRQREHVKEISGAGRQLLRLINNILDLNPTEEQMDLNLSQLSLKGLLDDAVTIFGDKAKESGLRLEVYLQEDLLNATVSADEVKIRNVLWNLLSNAVKFTPDGGRITVEVCGKDEYAVISVSDTGHGVDPKDHERIFDYFTQLDSSLSRHHEGTGVGLALAKSIVELHGGKIWVESGGPGSGSTFRFTIPCESFQCVSGGEQAMIRLAPVEDSEGTPLAESPKSDRHTILVVEDDPVNMKLTGTMLQLAGYEVLRAYRAEEALQIAQAQSPCLILMDIALPGMDGFEATKQLKGNPSTSHIPIIAVTAHAMRGDEQRALSNGCDGYLAKPVHRQCLTDTVAAFVAKIQSDRTRSW